MADLYLSLSLSLSLYLSLSLSDNVSKLNTTGPLNYGDRIDFWYNRAPSFFCWMCRGLYCF